MTTQTHRIAFTALIIASAFIQGGCSSTDSHPARPGAVDEAFGSTPSGKSSAALAAQCATGDTRRCQFHLPEHNGVRPCVLGFQICEDTVWGGCIEGENIGTAGTAVDAGSPRDGG